MQKMNLYLWGSLALLCGPSDLAARQSLGTGGSANQNHVITTTYRQPFAVAPANPTTAQAMRDITYYDGLGRPVQQVEVKASGGTGYKDLVTPVVYDGLGRQIYDYLPYATMTGAGGAYKSGAVAAQAAYYSATPPVGQPANSQPYSRTVFEPSPLNRVLEQGSPGAVWQPASSRTAASGRTAVTSYATNNTVSFATVATTRQVSRYRVALASDGTPPSP